MLSHEPDDFPRVPPPCEEEADPASAPQEIDPLDRARLGSFVEFAHALIKPIRQLLSGAHDPTPMTWVRQDLRSEFRDLLERCNALDAECEALCTLFAEWELGGKFDRPRTVARLGLFAGNVIELVSEAEQLRISQIISAQKVVRRYAEQLFATGNRTEDLDEFVDRVEGNLLGDASDLIRSTHDLASFVRAGARLFEDRPHESHCISDLAVSFSTRGAVVSNIVPGSIRVPWPTAVSACCQLHSALLAAQASVLEPSRGVVDLDPVLQLSEPELEISGAWFRIRGALESRRPIVVRTESTTSLSMSFRVPRYMPVDWECLDRLEATFDEIREILRSCQGELQFGRSTSGAEVEFRATLTFPPGAAGAIGHRADTARLVNSDARLSEEMDLRLAPMVFRGSGGEAVYVYSGFLATTPGCSRLRELRDLVGMVSRALRATRVDFEFERGDWDEIESAFTDGRFMIEWSNGLNRLLRLRGSSFDCLSVRRAILDLAQVAQFRDVDLSSPSVTPANLLDWLESARNATAFAAGRCKTELVISLEVPPFHMFPPDPVRIRVSTDQGVPVMLGRIEQCHPTHPGSGEAHETYDHFEIEPTAQVFNILLELAQKLREGFAGLTEIINDLAHAKVQLPDELVVTLLAAKDLGPSTDLRCWCTQILFNALVPGRSPPRRVEPDGGGGVELAK